MSALLLAVITGLIAAVIGVLVNWFVRPKWVEAHPGRLVAIIVMLVMAGALVPFATDEPPNPPSNRGAESAVPTSANSTGEPGASTARRSTTSSATRARDTGSATVRFHGVVPIRTTLSLDQLPPKDHSTFDIDWSGRTYPPQSGGRTVISTPSSSAILYRVLGEPTEPDATLSECVSLLKDPGLAAGDSYNDGFDWGLCVRTNQGRTSFVRFFEPPTVDSWNARVIVWG
jgi:hypothetical protein